MSAPGPYFRNNVANFMNLAEAMHEQGVRMIVFSSSCSVYGMPERMPIAESAPYAPLSPYGESKVMVERMLHWHGRAWGLGWCSLRYFNAAGAALDGSLGERHEPETHLIPRAMQAALGERSEGLELFGTDYPTSDGTAVRDYIHVEDLADAHLAALRYLIAGGACAPFNLGTGAGYSVREVIAMIERVSGRTVPVRERPRREGDSPALIADCSKAAAALRWAPRHSSLERIVETAWKWHTRSTK
jgi:UDP-glucose-4-epimerase GalE